MASAALFLPDGPLIVPTGITRGPWSEDAQHGGAAAALIAREVERCETPVPMQVARLTIELLRPVPIVPLRLQTEVRRRGRRIQLVAISVTAEDVEVASAVALLIRIADVPIPPEALPGPTGLPSDPATAAVLPTMDGPESYVRDGVELRFAAGSFDAGPATVWVRLRCPVVAGEDPTPLQRLAAAADFGNGVSRLLPFEDHLFMNPDLTIGVLRLPAGEWVGLDAVTHLSMSGTGQAESTLFDERGLLGRAVQSLFVDRR